MLMQKKQDFQLFWSSQKFEYVMTEISSVVFLFKGTLHNVTLIAHKIHIFLSTSKVIISTHHAAFSLNCTG